MSEKMNLQTALDFAVTTEQQGAAFYDRMATRYGDQEELKELFSVLARDEEVHEFQFKRLREKLPPEDRAELSGSDADYLEALSYTRFFMGEREWTDISSSEDALSRAFQLEQSAILFYTTLRDSLGASEVLDTIIATEKVHLRQVMKYMITGAKMRGLLDAY